MALLTGEEIRSKYGVNPDTLTSIGGKFDDSSLGGNTQTPQQTSVPFSSAANLFTPSPTQTPTNNNKMLTGEEVRSQYGVNPDTLVSQGGKYSLSQVLGNGGGNSPLSVGSIGALNVPTPVDLIATYRSLVQDSGISEIQSEIDAKTKSYNDAQAKINDNPYYSEATRVGRSAKLKDIFDADRSRLENKVATKKADIDTLIGLQTKQFDINSQTAQMALSQFNTLLDAGALNSASPTDIANITRSTGLSSAMIQSAVNAKKVAGYNTTTQTFDDGANEGFVIYTVDQMGNIVNQVKQITGTSSKAQKYSSDKQVSDYIDAIIKNNVTNTGGSIDDLWGGSTTPSRTADRVTSYVG